MSRKNKNQQETGLGSDFVPSRLRPIDIQQQEFSTSFRGYEPTEVDAFLDRLTEDFATLHEENKRLKEGGPLTPASGAVAADADAVLRQAHAQADAILNEARTRAAAIATGGAPGGEDALAAVWPFLAKEREFLRALAASVQEHAEGVKRQAKQLQESSRQAPLVATPKPVAAPERAVPPASPAGSSPVLGESAWTQTAGAVSSSVVKIPPSPVDTPPTSSGPAVEDGEEKGEEPTLRELFWNDDA